MENGELGEIGIAGVGLALGYMNRDELTMKKFIRDFLNIQNNPSGRIYRTGDLGRIDENGEIEYRGRIDTQVKIRGYRIELNEIEAVLLDLPQIAQAAVTTFEAEPGVVELVAYYAFKQGAELPRDEISQALRGKLPPYMVPAFLEELPSIPMTLSNKADHKRLPKPQLARFSSATQATCAPKTENERILHAALCRGAARRPRLDRASFLRRSRRQLAADGARLRDDPQEPAHGERVDARHLHESDDRASSRDHLDHGHRRLRRDQARAVPRSVEPRLLHLRRAAAAFYAAYALFGLWVLDAGYQWAVAADGALELYCARRGLRRGIVRRADRRSRSSPSGC